MTLHGTSEVEAALLDAIQHARFHLKNEIALSLAFALERHRLGGARRAVGLRSGGADLPYSSLARPSTFQRRRTKGQ